MFKAIQTGQMPFADHLDQCEPCRQLFELLKLVEKAGDLTGPSPAPSNLYRARAIALQASSRRPSRTLTGELAHDSWAGLPAQQVRDAAYSGERQLRFRAGEFMLELVIEKTAEKYEVVGRVYEQGVPSTRFLLQIGRRKLIPGNHKCYYWQ